MPAPYFPSLSLLAKRVAGKVNTPAKEFLHANFYSPDFSKVTLNIPLVGGGRRILKSRAEELIISEHGYWRHNHLGAIMSLCGRLPYYPHYEPEIRVLINFPTSSFSLFSSNIESWLIKKLLPASPEVMMEQLRENPAANALSEDISEAFPADASVIMYLMKFGPYATLPLLAALSNITDSETTI